MDIIVMGPPGAGKGTQAHTIAAARTVPHVATGDLFRDAVHRETPLGQEARVYMERGELVPDAVTVALVLERLEQPDAAQGVVFDGFPRTLAQAQALDTAFAARARRVQHAVYLNVPREAILRRVSGRWLCDSCQAPYHTLYHPPSAAGYCDACGGVLAQRSDDRRETAERRLDVYLEQTAPVIDYYRQRGVLREVDGDRPIEDIQRDVLAAVAATVARL
jgi:adenylate kinase